MLKFKNLLLKSLLLFAIGCLSSSNLNAQDEAYTQKLYKYLELSGSKANAMASINQMIEGMKSQTDLLPDEFYDKMGQRFDDSYGELVEMLVPVYYKYFDTKDLDALIAFQESEAGKKMTSVMPMVLQESISIGQTWGAQIGEEIMEEIMESGIGE